LSHFHKRNVAMPGIVQCFLCKASLFYNKNNHSTFVSHLSSEHNAFFGTNFLLAGCIMNEDERVAMFNAVKDRAPSSFIQSQNLQEESNKIIQETDEIIIDNEDEEEYNELYVTALTPETTLQEIDTVEVEEEQGVSPPKPDSKTVIKFSCPECPLTFNLKIKLNKHLKLHDKKGKVVKKIYESKKELKKEAKLKKSGTHNSKQTNRVWSQKETEAGVPCSECGKPFKSRANMMRHVEDIHQAGEYPCKGCGKMFTSKNKMGSHYSRNCNPSNPGRRKTII